MAKRLRVYISGPHSKGDVMANIRRALDTAEEVLQAGHLPYVPHLTAFWHMVHPHEELSEADKQKHRWWAEKALELFFQYVREL